MTELEQAIKDVKRNPDKLRRIFTEIPEFITDNEFLLLDGDMDTFCEMYIGKVTAVIKSQAESLNKCRKCNGNMIDSVAIEQTYTGIPDFIGSDFVCTVSPGGPGKLIDCLKCDSCGWSVTK